MLPTLAEGWRASAVRSEEAGHFRKVASNSIITAGSPCSALDTLNCGQLSGLNIANDTESNIWSTLVPITRVQVQK